MVARTAVNKRQKEHQKLSNFDQKVAVTIPSTRRKQSLPSFCFFYLPLLSVPAQTSDFLHLSCSHCQSLLSVHAQITALMTVYVSFSCNGYLFLIRLLPLLLFLLLFPFPVINTCLCTIYCYFLIPFCLSLFLLSIHAQPPAYALHYISFPCRCNLLLLCFYYCFLSLSALPQNFPYPALAHISIP